MRSEAEIRRVLELASEGHTASHIAQLTGVPGRTVRGWLADRPPRARPPFDPADLPPASYAYAFGMYLGDGCLLRHPRGVWRLEISLDLRYPGIVDSCAHAVADVMPYNDVAIVTDHGKGAFAIVRCYSKAWPSLFPQPGPGPKHTRSIVLEPWQERIVDEQPERFVRGRPPSDGCRVLNRVNAKDYPPYHFTQVSDDIRRLFCRSLRQLGIEYTWNDARNVSIARRASVARLDEFVGPKR